MDDYIEKIHEVLSRSMSKRGYRIWCEMERSIPNIWNKPTSSTGKYHKKQNGDIPNIAEHVYHMLYAASKIIRLFGFKNNTVEADKLYMAIAFHDSLKYGDYGNRAHTDNEHDKNAADKIISANKHNFLKIFTEDQFNILEEAVRFHSGRWSTDVYDEKKFKWDELNPETFFVHILDMLSTADLIQTDVRE